MKYSVWPNIYGKFQFSILIPTWKNKAVQVQEIAFTKDPRVVHLKQNWQGLIKSYSIIILLLFLLLSFNFFLTDNISP